MAKKHNPIDAMRLPFSISEGDLSYVTHVVQVLGVARLDEAAQRLILDCKLCITRHRYNSQSVSEEQFKEVVIPYKNILDADLKRFRWRKTPSKLIIRVDSQQIIADLPVYQPGAIRLQIDPANRRVAGHFAYELRMGSRINR